VKRKAGKRRLKIPVKRNFTGWGLLLLLIFLTQAATPRARGDQILEGKVVSWDDGTPIPDAKMFVWKHPTLIQESRTDADGRFRLSLAAGYYDLYIHADNPLTIGADYLPYHAVIEDIEGGENRIIELKAGASVVFQGSIQFVDTEDLPIRIGYQITDAETGKTLIIDGFLLEYGTSVESQSEFLGIDLDQAIVPVNTVFTVNINATVLYKGNLVHRSINIDDTGLASMSQGELLVVDIQRGMLAFNLGEVDSLLERVEGTVYEMEEKGFYLTVEKTVLANAMKLVEDSRALRSLDLYIESFSALKTAYISIVELEKDADALYRDAISSIYILILFVTISSSFLSFFLLNTINRQIVSSILSSSIFLFLLHETYPGVKYVTMESFIINSALAIGASLIVATVSPRLLKSRRKSNKVSFVNMVVPIFSIAKRALKRSRVRLVLTVVSVVLFVMAFVVLTSFSMGYGLVTRRISDRMRPTDGVMLRDVSWKRDAPTFMQVNDVTRDWLLDQPESISIAPKVENIPTISPLISSGNLRIWGILGFDPTSETLLTGIDDIVVEGEFIDESLGSVILSVILRDDFGVTLGEEISYGLFDLEVVGFFDDSIFNKRDLDGSRLLPDRLSIRDVGGERPRLTQRLCEPEETMICNLDTALRLPMTGISRVDIIVEEENNVVDFAERMALERGYRAVSSSDNGLYVSEVGTFLQGKGLPVLVPGIIVVLNVGVLILNAMYERRKEIGILSSIGLNPGHISAIFIAEAMIIGTVGGGIGYLFGLGFYKLMAILDFSFEVGQKVSASWSLSAVGISMITVVFGAIFALKNSTVITPSLIRRWRIESQPPRSERGFQEPFEVLVPVKLEKEELDEFVDFFMNALKRYTDEPEFQTAMIRLEEPNPDDGIVRHMAFVYKAASTMVGSLYSVNDIFIESTPGSDVLGIMLRSTGNKDWVHQVGTFVRLIAMEYSTTKVNE
jgi:ABC-type lipoprotein release transport system permease subunit